MSSGGETSGGGGGGLGAGLGGGLGSGSNPSEKDKNDALYEDREPKKIIRIITVMAYMFSVSFVGITLSAYYIFLWHPPNPRLMHAQTMSMHSEARVNFLSDEAVELAKNAEPALLSARGLDFFGAQPQSDALKTRREIVKNVNAILRANFEKTRTSEMPFLAVTEDMQGLQLVNDTDNANNTTATPSLDNIAKSSTFRASDSLTIEPTEQLSSISHNTDDPTINTGISRESTVTPTTISQMRRTKSPSKKQHQTPFALKHLEVPIKSDGPRRRSTRLGDTITTTSSSNIPLSTRGNSYDKSTPSSLSTESSRTFDTTNPQEIMKSLYRTLTTPSGLREADHSSSTNMPLPMPSISSDQFQAIPHSSVDDYHDSTIQPVVDDLMEDHSLDD